MQTLFNLIKDIAKVPSFSTYEERLHPYVLNVAERIKDCRIHHIPDNNIVLEIPGSRKGKPIALAAHLDKINHFGQNEPEELPFRMGTSFFEGVLDDAVGVAICLRLAQDAQFQDFPPLLILLSEMEESTGLKKHPELLKNGGEGYHHGMGAERIAEWLIAENKLPEFVITVDTTPIFRGENGVALYGRHWEFTNQKPSKEEELATEELCDAILEIDHEVLRSNNTNDYLHYGRILNNKTNEAIPSVALEPAISPYHQADERVYFSDIERTYSILKTLLESR